MNKGPLSSSESQVLCKPKAASSLIAEVQPVLATFGGKITRFHPAIVFPFPWGSLPQTPSVSNGIDY